MCVFLRCQLGLAYTPEAWHYPHHFWSILVLRRRERVRKRWEKEHRGKQNVWWENTRHETHRPIYMAPTLVYRRKYKVTFIAYTEIYYIF